MHCFVHRSCRIDQPDCAPAGRRGPRSLPAKEVDVPRMLTISDPEGVKLEAKKFFASSPEARFARRLDAVLLVCEGHPVPQVSNLFGLNPTTIQRWIHRLNEEGLDGLRDKPGRGRPSRLNTDLRDKVRMEIADSPDVFGYTQSRWDGKLLSQHLRDHYGVNLKVRQCQNILSDLNDI